MWLLALILRLSEGHWLYPEQVRTSWTSNPNEIQVLWVTYIDLSSYLSFRPILCDLDSTWSYLESTTKAFDEGTNTTRIQYIHSATLKSLDDYCYYEYSVSNGPFWSEIFTISGRTPSNPDQKDPFPAEFIVLGDWGTGPNGQYSVELLKRESKLRDFNAVLHIGDFAYDLNDDEGRVGDRWLNQIQTISANYAYMTLPGNHEKPNNFTHYKQRFAMPVNDANEGSNYFYSFNFGPAHIIMINTEGYFYYNNITTVTQLNWLKNDLKSANLFRHIRPWVIVLTHHPLYCSLDWVESFKACGPDAVLLQNNLEELFYNESVDIVFQAHVHNYERDTPIYKNSTVYGQYDSEYLHVGPKAPIYITSGNAGNCEGPNTPEVLNPNGWSQAWSSEFGYGRMVVINGTHFYYEQFGAVSSKRIDHVWVVKTEDRYSN